MSAFTPRRREFLFGAAVSPILAQSAGQGDASGPPPLRVHRGGRYLVDPRNRPVFLLADTAWSLTRALTRPEITEYLARRRAQRFNAIAVSLLDTPREADPARDYWTTVDFALAEMSRLGLYAIVLPAWGSAVVGGYDGGPSKEGLFSEATGYAYAKWLAARYRSHKHVIWMLGGDRSAVYPGRDFRPVFRAMARGIREAAGPEPLISYHPRKVAPQSSEWFHDDDWLSFNSIQHWPEVQSAAISHDWGLPHVKPTWIFEGRYEGYWKNGYKPEQWGEWQMRFQAYESVFSGAFGFTYGHERIFGFGKDDGWDWRKELDAPGAQSMTRLADLMNSLSPAVYLSRVPDQGVVVGEAGKTERLRSDRIIACRSADRSFAMLYTANGSPVRVRREALKAGVITATWYDPRRGTRQTARATNAEYVPPQGGQDGNDWVLILSIG